jgi:SSS family solute:Na+ symporter
MQIIDLTIWDSLTLIGYLLLLLFLGYRASKHTDLSSPSDFLLADRSLSLPAFVATLVTTWYGGILGVGEFSYQYGIATWVVFGLPYYVFALIFAFLLAGKIRKAGLFTIPDMFYKRYGKKVGVLSSIFLLFMTTPAPYVLMVAVLIQAITGLSFLLSLLLGTLASVIYVFMGGFRAVVRTDKFQFLLMYGSFVLILLFLYFNYGGLKFLEDNLGSHHFAWHGGNSVQYIVVWFFLASWTFIDPGFHQRSAAAKSAAVAQKGILVSIIFWFIFDALTISTGLYAAAILRDIDPVLAYPILADNVLPPFVKGLFLTGLLAVIMSTIDSFTLLSAMTFGKDIVSRNISDQAVNRENYYTRLGLILTAVISIALVIVFPSVIKLWYIIGSLFIPPMLLPLLTAYHQRFRLPALQTHVAMILSFVAALSCFLWGHFDRIAGAPNYPLNVEPFFPGLVTSSIIYFVLNIFKKPGLNKNEQRFV